MEDWKQKIFCPNVKHNQLSFGANDKEIMEFQCCYWGCHACSYIQPIDDYSHASVYRYIYTYLVYQLDLRNRSYFNGQCSLLLLLKLVDLHTKCWKHTSHRGITDPNVLEILFTANIFLNGSLLGWCNCLQSLYSL